MAALDPAIAEFVRRVTDAWAAYPDLDRRPLAEQRVVAEAVRAPWRDGGPALPRRDVVARTPVGEIRLRFYGAIDPGKPRPVLLYAHGGGFSSFSLDTHDRILREYAAGASVVVAGVDYALSPEAKHPVALEQMIAATHWAAGEGARLGLDAGRIALGGDSAGANLALAAAIALRDAGRPVAVRALLLAYGFFDDDLTYESNRLFGQAGALLSNAELAGYIDNYVGGTPFRGSPLAFPAKAPMDGLPPSFHLIAACDPLADSDRAVAVRMRAAGCVVDARVYEGASHSFLEAVAIAPLAARALAESADWLAEQLGGR